MHSQAGAWEREKIMKRIITISVIIGTVVSALMMDVAWEHNSQCEIHCEGVINFSYWILIGLSWFITSFVVVFAFGILVKIIKKMIRL